MPWKRSEKSVSWMDNARSGFPVFCLFRIIWSGFGGYFSGNELQVGKNTLHVDNLFAGERRTILKCGPEINRYAWNAKQKNALLEIERGTHAPPVLI